MFLLSCLDNQSVPLPLMAVCVCVCVRLTPLILNLLPNQIAILDVSKPNQEMQNTSTEKLENQC